MKLSIKMILTIFCFCFVFFLIGVKAGAGYSSDEIYYGTTGTSVTSALNELYAIKTELTSLKASGDAINTNILTGKTAVVQGKLVNGTMNNKSGNIIKATTVVADSTNNTKANISIPESGFYDTTSKIQISFSEINKVNTIVSRIQLINQTGGHSYSVPTTTENTVTIPNDGIVIVSCSEATAGTTTPVQQSYITVNGVRVSAISEYGGNGASGQFYQFTAKQGDSLYVNTHSEAPETRNTAVAYLLY